MGVMGRCAGRVRFMLGRPQRRQERLRSPRPLVRPGPAPSAPLGSRRLRRRLRSSLAPLAAVLAGPGPRRAASPFESTRTACGSVGTVGLVPPQPLAVLAALRASALARTGASGGRQVSGRHEVARGEPAAGCQRAPVGLTGLARTSRATGRPAGSTDRKRAGALSVEAASEASVPEHSGARAGRCGDSAPQWNLHARMLRLPPEPWRTPEGRGRSVVPGRRKHPTERRALRAAREARSESRRPERPRASVASPPASHTPRLREKSENIEQNGGIRSEVTT
jgi:hypothetical protein